MGAVNTLPQLFDEDGWKAEIWPARQEDHQSTWIRFAPDQALFVQFQLEMIRLSFGFLALVALSSSLALAGQSGAILYQHSQRGTEVSVPSQGGEAPSVLLRNGVFATGRAATILSEKAEEPGPERLDSNAGKPRRRVVPLYEDGAYIGSLTQISESAFIGSAHVVAYASQSSLDVLKRFSSQSSTAVSIYQFKSRSKFEDAVVVSTRPLGEAELAAASSLFSDDGSGTQYTSNQLVEFDGHLVSQTNRGSFSRSIDGQAIYLKSENDTFFTWGSSGVVVESTGDANTSNTSILGIIQCVVKIKAAASSTSDSASFFRAISGAALANATLIQSSIVDLQSRRADYDLEKCSPVSGKNGGGG